MSYNMCQRTKIKKHCLYDILQSLFQFTELQKEITMNFITDLSLSSDEDTVEEVESSPDEQPC